MIRDFVRRGKTGTSYRKRLGIAEDAVAPLAGTRTSRSKTAMSPEKVAFLRKYNLSPDGKRLNR